VDQELLLRNEYLVAENRILKSQLKGRLKLSDVERTKLGEIDIDWAERPSAKWSYRPDLKLHEPKTLKSTCATFMPNAEVVEAFCSRCVHHRDRHQHTIPIALAALPTAELSYWRTLA
jgi:hypothetical protein